MATLQEIKDFLDRKHPDNGIGDEDFVSDLQDTHVDLFMQLQRLTNSFAIFEGITVANQFSYSLPPYCRLEDIVGIEVATNTAETDFNTFLYAGYGDDNNNGRFYGRHTETEYYLTENGKPISVGSLTISITYYPRPLALDYTDMTQVPELDVDYHELLKFSAVQKSFEDGSHPDTELSDYWQRKFDEKLEKVKESIEERLRRAPTKAETMEVW